MFQYFSDTDACLMVLAYGALIVLVLWAISSHDDHDNHLPGY